MEAIKHKYPKSLVTIAEQIGHARGVMNAQNNKVNTRFDRGDKNSYVDTLGALGELIAIDYLITKNIPHQMTKLLDFKSSKNADVILKGKKIDIKTMAYKKHLTPTYFLVNEEAHKKGKNKIDKYWFIYILNKINVEFYFVDYDIVTSWSVKKMGYTNAHYIDMNEIAKN